MVVDIGGGTTDIAVFDQGSVRQTAVIGLGGQNVTSDIAICLRTGWPQAELIKCQHGVVREDAVQPGDKLEIPGISGRAPTSVGRTELAAIIEARGSSSAASAASATIDAARDWLYGSAENDWVSMAVASNGEYGVPEGLISSFPVTTSGGDWKIVEGLEIDDFSRGKIDASTAELADERDAVTELGLI